MAKAARFAAGILMAAFAYGLIAAAPAGSSIQDTREHLADPREHILCASCHY